MKTLPVLSWIASFFHFKGVFPVETKLLKHLSSKQKCAALEGSVDCQSGCEAFLASTERNPSFEGLQFFRTPKSAIGELLWRKRISRLRQRKQKTLTWLDNIIGNVLDCKSCNDGSSPSLTLYSRRGMICFMYGEYNLIG